MKPDIFCQVDEPPTCKLQWDHVEPEQKQWFCSHCRHHVYNLSAMTRREAKKFMRSPSIGRRCISFLQDERGRTIFCKAAPLFSSVRASLAWLVSALFVLLASGCATSPKKEPVQKNATVAQLTEQNDQNSPQKTGKPRRRWTGF